MKREELLRRPAYWVSSIQNELYRQIDAYMKEHNMNKAQFAEMLGCSRGYVTQLLNGDFDHKLSKLVELSVAIGKAPVVDFKDIDHIDDAVKYSSTTTLSIAPDKIKFEVITNNERLTA